MSFTSLLFQSLTLLKPVNSQSVTGGLIQSFSASGTYACRAYPASNAERTALGVDAEEEVLNVVIEPSIVNASINVGDNVSLNGYRYDVIAVKRSNEHTGLHHIEAKIKRFK